MGGWSEDLLAGLATTPWQPQSIRPPVRDSMPLRLRIGVLAAVALLHVVATLLLLQLVERNRDAGRADAIVVDFIDAPPPPPPPPPPVPNETITIRMPTAAPMAPVRPAESAPPVPRAPRRPHGTAPMQAVDAPHELQLYNRDGSLHVPADMLDKLDREFGDKRVFSYQIPHMDDAKKYFDRNPALVYESTRFDQYWTPDGDALTSLLTKLVKETTKKIKVKVPGTSGSYMVCEISILALGGGGCGVLTNGADWNGPQDDPNTLNPEEDRQCAAWWQQIIGAKTQDAWRATKKLYESQCRKPLLRAPAG